MRVRLHPGLLLTLLLAAACVLACRLGASGVLATAERSSDTLSDLLGGGRAFLGGVAMNRADLRLHRGLGGVDQTAFTNRWLQRLEDAISPKIVEHREGQEGLQDVLPYVSLATLATPTNTDYALTQSFLIRAVGRPELALSRVRALRGSQPNNPELPLEEARIRMARNQWERAADALETCTRLIGPQPTTNQSPTLAEACMWRGLLYERSGNSNAAADSLASAIRLEPGMYQALSNRVVALRAGKPPDVPVAKVLAQYQRMSANPLCEHDHGAEHGHDHDRD